MNLSDLLVIIYVPFSFFAFNTIGSCIEFIDFRLLLQFIEVRDFDSFLTLYKGARGKKFRSTSENATFSLYIIKIF